MYCIKPVSSNPMNKEFYMVVTSIHNHRIISNQNLQSLSDLSTRTLNMDRQFGTKDTCLHYLEYARNLGRVLFQWAEDRFPCLHNRDEYDSMTRLCTGMCGIFCKKYVMYLFFVYRETLREHLLGGAKGRTRYNLAVIADTKELGFDKSIHMKLWHLLVTNYFCFVCPRRSTEDLYHFLHAITHSDVHITIKEDLDQDTRDRIEKEEDIQWFFDEYVTIKQTPKIDHGRFANMKFSKQLLRHYSIDTPCLCQVNYPRNDWESRRELCDHFVVSKIEVPYVLNRTNQP